MSKNQVRAWLSTGIVAACLLTATACSSAVAEPLAQEGAGSTTSAEGQESGLDTAEESGAESADPESEEGPGEPNIITLALDGKASTRLAAAGDAGETSLEQFPVEVTVTDVTCATKTASDVGYDEDGDSKALKAPAGEQLCLVTMSVKNVGKAPSFWSLTSGGGAAMVMKDGTSFTETDLEWSAGSVANSRDTKYAGDGDLINPGKTEYDYALFAVPVSQAPVGIDYTDYGY